MSPSSSHKLSSLFLFSFAALKFFMQFPSSSCLILILFLIFLDILLNCRVTCTSCMLSMIETMNVIISMTCRIYINFRLYWSDYLYLMTFPWSSHVFDIVLTQNYSSTHFLYRHNLKLKSQKKKKKRKKGRKEKETKTWIN